MRYERRKGALERLEAQLKTGTKPQKVEGKSTGKLTELTEKDIKRINSEISTLKIKLV